MMNGQSSRSHSSESIDRIIEKGINFHNKFSDAYYGIISLLYSGLGKITTPLRNIRRYVFRRGTSSN